ncbi:glycosyltransferase family protein [Mucilaginibacter oryzae]|nr:hypothetical protein [Mucilaginibacter oryzae]
MKLPISAIVVGLNEAHLLRESLPKLAFCDELLYFDLGSKDDSIKLATGLGATVIKHDKVDSCEWIHAEYATKTKHEWVLISDPDEMFPDELITEITLLFENGTLNESIGAVWAPWVFYFKNHRLFGTHWGGVSRRIILAHNKRFEFKALVHAGRKLIGGFNEYNIEYTGNNFIAHKWMQSYGKLIEKHRRYLRNEGEARYKTGRRSSAKSVMKEAYRAFKYSYWSRRGYKDGITGLFLSAFWVWYECSAQIENIRYQRKIEKKKHKTAKASFN